jgi:hypothetical protein
VVASAHPAVIYFDEWTYTLSNGVLRLGGGQEVLTIAFNGTDEFTIKPQSLTSSDIAGTLAYALCHDEVRKRGYDNVEQAGIQFSSVNGLTIKFQRLTD